MAISQEQALVLVKKNKGGDIDSIYGPCPMGPVRIFQIWVWVEEDNEYDTRFVTEIEGEAPKYFENFTTACEYINKLYVEAAKQARDTDHKYTKELIELQLKKFSSYVAAFVFVLTVVVFLLLVYTKNSTESLILTALLGVVASGGALFFGRWVPGGTAGGGPS